MSRPEVVADPIARVKYLQQDFYTETMQYPKVLRVGVHFDAELRNAIHAYEATLTSPVNFTTLLGMKYVVDPTMKGARCELADNST